MKRTGIIYLSILLSIFCSAGFAYSQIRDDGLRAKFEDPSKEGTIYINWRNGDISIKGSNKDEVEVDIHGRQRRPDRDIRGMRRVYDGDSVELETEGNRINIECHSRLKEVDADIYVPEGATLIIENSLNGDVKIDNVKGRIEVKTLNGDIEVREAGAPVDLYSTNGDIIIDFVTFTFSDEVILRTLNSAIDLTLPAESKATLYMKTNDEIYIDNDFTLERSSGRGRYSRSSREYQLNGGGVEISLSSMNGNIYIRKGR